MPLTRDEIMRIAKCHDPRACWASDDADENCLLTDNDTAIFLLDTDTTAWEDPNPPGSDNTRVIFPNL